MTSPSNPASYIAPYVTTHSGNCVSIMSPEPELISIHDIAHALSNQCRFTGHTDEHYSVAQHCVLVSRMCSPENRMAGLLHDAPEYLIGDVSSPLKSLLPNYQAIERVVWAVIAKKFSLPQELPAEVKHNDLVALAAERRDLLTNASDRWPVLDGISPPAGKVEPLSPVLAEREFLLLYAHLERARKNKTAEEWLAQ